MAACNARQASATRMLYDAGWYDWRPVLASEEAQTRCGRAEACGATRRRCNAR